MLKENKGITIIALVVTIVVLLILASVTINGVIQGVDESEENKLLSEISMVQNAITQRYTKYKLTKDRDMLVGTRIQTSTLEDVPNTITWKVTQFDETNNPEKEYYRLSKLDLSKLGLSGDDKSHSSYVVNYSTGEVYNETSKQTKSGKVLYVTNQN